ncbi:MAG: carboxyl transferase domain-containing protein [Corynebacterium sp.]|nr:carboxyl transferase domain-containing protein [Corynebacterium sp.]
MTDTPDLKTTAGKIADLENRLAASRSPLGDNTPLSEGLTARQRVEELLDAGSFVETDALARHRSTDFDREHNKPETDGVITGYGTIDGRKACVYSIDATIFDGTLGEVSGEKIVKIYDLAIKTGVPIVSIVESAGARVQEGIVTMAMYARILARAAKASGLIPQVSIIVGDNEGIAGFPPALADIVIMTTAGALHQAAPLAVKEVFDQELTGAELGGAAVHSNNGTAHVVVESDSAALAAARDVLGYLPINNRAETPRSEADIMSGSVAENITAADRKLDAIIPDDDAIVFDMSNVVEAIVDSNSFFELQPQFAPNMITGFARIEGRAIGVVANQPAALGGALDSRAAEKAARFIRTCDLFNTPVVTFVDSPGFIPSPEEETAGLVRRASALAFAYAETTVGTMTVICRKAIGPAFVFMGAKDLGVDFAYAWPTANITVATELQTADSIYGSDASPEQVEELAAKFSGPYQAAERGIVDAVIEPASTRGHLIEGLRLLERKVVPPIAKKYGNIVL